MKHTLINTFKGSCITICLILSGSFLYSGQDSSILSIWFRTSLAYYEQNQGINYNNYTDIYDSRFITEKNGVIRSLTDVKEVYELGIDQNSYVVHRQYLNSDISLPIVMSLEDHRHRMYTNRNYTLLSDNISNRLDLSNSSNNNSNKGINLFSQDVAGTNISVSLKGNISISGVLSFEERDNIATSSQQNDSWNLDINQTQKFNLYGNIGDKLSISAEQNSQSDFDWENSLLLEYNGAPNEVVQNVSAGNISLNLPHTQLVSVGMGKREGLFGVKLINQLGPLSFHTILGREKVQKTSQSIYGGESDDGLSITDYNYIKDKYFFIDKNFKRTFYPLDANGSHVVNSDYVVLEYQVFKRITTMNGIEPGIYIGTAFLDPNDESGYKQEGIWKKLTENVDYDINRYLGYLRLNTPSSTDVIAIHYTIGILDGSAIIEPEIPIYDIGTNIDVVYNQDEYDICLNTSGCEDGDSTLIIGTDYEDIDGDGIYTGQEIILKLIKDSGSSTPTSKTWPLMFKNVYSLGASNIDLNSLEVEIIHVGGQLGTETVSYQGNTFLNIFGIDNKNENGEIIIDQGTNEPVGDGKIDLNSNLINSQYGELILPFYMPFSYDEMPFEETQLQYDNGTTESLIRYWGNSHSDLSNLFDEDLLETNTTQHNISLNVLNENNIETVYIDYYTYNDGPAMYFSDSQSQITSEREFAIKVRNLNQSTTINLGFMIVEGSETLTLDGSIQLVKGVDYTIDYFTGTLNLISERAKDPTANIRISYDQNELVSFDQKLITGSYFKYDFNEINNIFGGAYLYTQSISEQKVDIGYEPLENIIWHVGGNFSREFKEINNYLNKNTGMNLEQPSQLNILAEFAQIFPNPNSLGEAYLDDFESSKRSTYLPIVYSSWKKSSPPFLIDEYQNISEIDIINNKKMYWYNPYDEISTQQIWPDIEISNTANNQTTKTLWLETDTTYFNENIETYWSGISVPLFPSDYDQSNNKYIDIWMNVEEVNDPSILFNIDIGYISEDSNDDSNLNSEDALTINGQLGNGLLDIGEDIGIDGCTNSYEDGWGGCLCSIYNNEISENSLNNIYSDPNELCEDPNARKYSEILALNSENIQDSINIYTDINDPNLDNFDYSEGASDCEGSCYANYNGTEQNSLLSGFGYPDTEDLNNNQSLDNINSYFTYSFNLLDADLNIIESETQFSELLLTGWKLFRIPLQDFEARIENEGYSLTWEDVRTMRLWISAENPEIYNLLKIAKIELVGNEWQYLGNVANNNIGNASYEEEEDFIIDDNITIQVINSEENADEYTPPEGVLGEYDEYGGRYTKEQSLVIDFSNLYDDDNDLEGGIDVDSTIFIKKNFGFSSMTTDKKNSFFAYRNMEMYINGIRDYQDNDVMSDWFIDDSTNVELCFRIGKDDDYYEIRQPFSNNVIENNGWENIKINLDELTRYKLNRTSLESYDDLGIDGCDDLYETGFPSEFSQCLPDSLIQDNISIITICNNLDDYIELNLIDSDLCLDDIDDPNQDNCLVDENGNVEIINECTQNNGQYDLGEIVIDDNNNNGIYDVPSEYNDEDDVWIWNEDISIACENCNELRVKGEPAINRIDYVMVGVINKTDSKIFGRVYLNELRMTGVKRDPGMAFLIDGHFDLGELLTIGGNFSQREADYHRLEERLGTGDHSIQYSFNLRLNPDKFFKEKFFTMPINFKYNKSISSPKYKPGSDIILGDIEGTPDSLQTLKDYITIYTTLQPELSNLDKENLLYKYIIDNTKINYTYKWENSSNPTTLREELFSHQVNLDYSLKFEDSEWFLFKDLIESDVYKYDSELYPYKLLKDFKINLAPEKIEYNVTLNSHDKITEKRISYGGTTVYDTSMTLTRSFKINNYKLVDNFNMNYRIDMNSNLNDLISNKYKFLTGISNIFDLSFSPGLVKSYSEQFSFTFTPSILDWLSPRFSYAPRYSWTRDLSTSIEPTADIRSENDFSATFTLSFQKLLDKFYTQDNQSSGSSSSSSRRSSRSSSRRNQSSSTEHKPFEIDNPYAKTFIKFLYGISQDISNVNLTYKYNTKHNYDNITTDFEPGYNFRLGLNSSPIDSDDVTNELGTSSNQILTYSNYYYDEFKISTSVQLAKNLSLSSMEYRITRSKSFPSNTFNTITQTETYLPLGSNGKDGFPIFKYSINLTGIEQYWELDKWFKTITISHAFNGENTKTIKDDIIEKDDFSRTFTPVIGISTKLKNNPINIKLNFNNTLTITNTGTQTERITKDQVTFSIDYTKKSGLRIPLPFLRDFEIDNEINLRLDLNYDNTSTDFSYVQTENLADFENTAFSKSFGIKPILTYSFSKYVDGDLYLNYVLTENHTTGKKKETNIGFKIRIYFESFE